MFKTIFPPCHLTINILLSCFLILITCTPTALIDQNSSSNNHGKLSSVCNCPSDSQTRTQSDIKCVINCRCQNLKNLYENALRRNRNLSGMIKVKFIINSDGSTTVKDYTVNSLKDSVFVTAILEDISFWKFSAKNAPPVEIIYPFVFEPEK